MDVVPGMIPSPLLKVGLTMSKELWLYVAGASIATGIGGYSLGRYVGMSSNRKEAIQKVKKAFPGMDNQRAMDLVSAISGDLSSLFDRHLKEVKDQVQTQESDGGSGVTTRRRARGRKPATPDSTATPTQ